MRDIISSIVITIGFVLIIMLLAGIVGLIVVMFHPELPVVSIALAVAMMFFALTWIIHTFRRL